MSNEYDGLPSSIRGVLRHSYRVETPYVEPEEQPLPVPSVRTEFSTTVFSGTPAEWVRYLGTSVGARYEPGVEVNVHLQDERHGIHFEPVNPESEWLANVLGRGLTLTRDRLGHKPNVVHALEELMFRTPGGTRRRVVVRLSPTLPTLGTREMEHPRPGGSGDVRLVLQSRFAHHLREVLGANPALSEDENLGVCWSLVSRFLSQLAFPDSPRDRFVAKIDVFAKMTFIALNLLYEERRSGKLKASPVGAVYETLISGASEMARSELFERHPYFRMLATLSFMLRAKPYEEYEGEARIAAREYLDATYLRLSLAGAMPEVPRVMAPMAFTRKRREVRVPKPEIGLYGIFDDEDLHAWKKVHKPFSKLGFTLLRQLGMGDFGRVYEVLNENNPAFPARVALKVDRIVGKKKNAILEAEEAFRVGRELASAPHLIRLYDTGTLRDERFTYHVLQLIDGDTLDNLVGVAGEEHASVERPSRSGRSECDAQREYERAVGLRGRQIWRRARMGLPFRFALSPAMLLDLLTSVLLSLEEVHQLGYAINDLKNDNLMMSRRGQIKAIDLDSFAPVRSDADKITDYMFLSASLILLLFNASAGTRRRDLAWEGLTQDEGLLRQELAESWPLGDVEQLSDGRVTKPAMTEVLVDLVLRSRRLTYAKQPGAFADDIVRLIEIKRSLLVEDLVID